MVRLTASKPGSLFFRATLKSAHEESQVAAMESGVLGPVISMSGGVKDSAIRFEARLNPRLDPMVNHYKLSASGIEVTGADSATLILSGSTNFQNYREVSADEKLGMPLPFSRRMARPSTLSEQNTSPITSGSSAVFRSTWEVLRRPPFPPTSASKPSRVETTRKWSRSSSNSDVI